MQQRPFAWPGPLADMEPPQRNLTLALGVSLILHAIVLSRPRMACLTCRPFPICPSFHKPPMPRRQLVSQLPQRHRSKCPRISPPRVTAMMRAHN
jgi:hypothetical protein